MALRDQIISAQDIKKETIDCPEWGCSIEVRTLSGLQRAQLLSTCLDETGKVVHEKFHPTLLTFACFEVGTDNRVFQAGDEKWLMEKSAGPIEQLVAAAMRLSGLTKEAAAKAEKNS